MAETKNTLLNKFIAIQKMQFELDKLKQEQRLIGKKIKGLAWMIPKSLREIDLK